MSPASRLMAGIMYSEVFLLMASTSANRLGSKLARETRTTAVVGNDSVVVILSAIVIHSVGNYIMLCPQNIIVVQKNPALILPCLRLGSHPKRRAPAINPRAAAARPL